MIPASYYFDNAYDVNAELEREGRAYVERIECPNCFGSGSDLDAFSEPIVCPLCDGACRVVEDTLPSEWKALRVYAAVDAVLAAAETCDDETPCTIVFYCDDSTVVHFPPTTLAAAREQIASDFAMLERDLPNWNARLVCVDELRIDCPFLTQAQGTYRIVPIVEARYI
jgi:hypothetical protein